MPSIFLNFHFMGGKNEEIFVKSILALKIKSFNIIIAIGWVLLWKAKILNMICHADRLAWYQMSYSDKKKIAPGPN